MEHKFNWFHDGKKAIVEIVFPQLGKRGRFSLATGTDNRPFKAIEEDLDVGINLVSEGQKIVSRDNMLNLFFDLETKLPALTGYTKYRW